MDNTLKNILIGIFVISAFGILSFMLLFLHPTVGDNAKTLTVRFADVDKVNVGTRVTYAGRPVGEVVEINEIPEARTSRINKNGDIYVYELILKVDSSVDVYNSDEITLRTSGLLGERNVEINPLPLKPNEKLQLVEHQVIFAEPTSSVEDTMKKLSIVADQFQIVLDDVHNVLDKFQKEEILEKVSHGLKNIVEISDALNQPKIWRETVTNIHTLSEEVNKSWKKVDTTLDNVVTVTDKANLKWSPLVDQTLEDVQKLISHTAGGNGSVGQLFMKDELYLRMKSIFHKGSTVMDDISHYGVLFQLDKRWQRLQGRRLKLLEKLSSPDEFAYHFSQEMDEISNSIYQVTQLLNLSNGCPQALIFNTDFTTRFSDLLRQVGTMEETLQLYNEQLVNQEP